MLIGIPVADWGASNLKRHFDRLHVAGFENDFLSHARDDILDLGNDVHPVLMPIKRKLLCVIAFYHSGSRDIGKPLAIETSTKQSFDEFRTSVYDPNKPVIPWKTVIPDPEVDKWKRNVKPNGRDFPDSRMKFLTLAGKKSASQH